MKARLRGHHLICLNFFRGEGYSDEFISNMYSVIRKDLVEVVKGPDDVCAHCPHLKDNRCASDAYNEEDILLQDREALELLKLTPGAIVDRRTVSAVVPTILEEWKALFCLNCVYRTVCFD